VSGKLSQINVRYISNSIIYKPRFSVSPSPDNTLYNKILLKFLCYRIAEYICILWLTHFAWLQTSRVFVYIFLDWTFFWLLFHHGEYWEILIKTDLLALLDLLQPILSCSSWYSSSDLSSCSFSFIFKNTLIRLFCIKTIWSCAFLAFHHYNWIISLN